MELWELAVTVLGAAMVIGVTADVALTVLHQDFEGPIAKAAQRGTWGWRASFRCGCRPGGGRCSRSAARG